MNHAGAAQAYARVGVETGVEGSDPRRLVIMLYDGVLACISEARGHLGRGDAPAKGIAIGRALRILQEGLAASLDQDSGGDIAKQLADLYDYIARRLLIANLRNDAGSLDEAARLLAELRGAWQAVDSGHNP